MLLYIIRHGDPVYETDSLTEKGKRQAAALAKRLAGTGIGKIYSSSAGRARETARPACELLGLDCLIEDWMNEAYAWREFTLEDGRGNRAWVFDALKNTQFKTDEIIALGEKWYEAKCFASSGAKEGYARIRRCSDDFLARLGFVREGRVYKIADKAAAADAVRAAVFCHQGFGLVWLSYLLAIPPHLFWPNFDVTHAGMTVLEFKDSEDGYTAPKCLCLSDTSHIYEAGLPMLYNNVILF